MRTFYIIVISGMLVVFTLLLFPTLHFVYGSMSLVGFLPLTAAAVTLLPYALIGFCAYIIIKLSKK